MTHCELKWEIPDNISLMSFEFNKDTVGLL